MIVIDQLFDFIEPHLLPARVGAVPSFVPRLGREMVEVLVLRVGSVVGHTRQRAVRVGLMAELEPGEAGAEVFGHAEPQAVFLRGFLPIADHVALGPHVGGVPLVELRVPEEEIVVMGAHADEVTGAGFLVERHQPLGVPFLGLPEGDNVLVAVGRGVAVGFEVVLVYLVSRQIQPPGIPISHHRHGLGSPVRPNTELRVPKPLRTMIIGERCHRRLEFAGCNGQGPRRLRCGAFRPMTDRHPQAQQDCQGRGTTDHSLCMHGFTFIRPLGFRQHSSSLRRAAGITAGTPIARCLRTDSGGRQCGPTRRTLC